MPNPAPLPRWIALLLSLGLLVGLVVGQKCDAGCSTHVTLPCSFGSLDPCMAQKCKQMCEKDGSRRVVGCFCRGVQDGPTIRTCFCGPSSAGKNHSVIVF